MVRFLLPMLVLMVALAGCASPLPSEPSAGGGASDEAQGVVTSGTADAGRVLVVGVFVEVVDVAEAERVAAEGGGYVSCDQAFSVRANYTARRLAYASALGLGRPDPALAWIEVSETWGPQPQDPSRCPPDPYGVSFLSWGDRPKELAFGDYRASIPFAAWPTGEVEVDGTRLLAGEHWTRTVDETIRGTRYAGKVTVVNFGLWPVGNVTEGACAAAGCAPPFHDEPGLRWYASRHPEGRRP